MPSANAICHAPKPVRGSSGRLSGLQGHPKEAQIVADDVGVEVIAAGAGQSAPYVVMTGLPSSW